jgi:hypothetical protein
MQCTLVRNVCAALYTLQQRKKGIFRKTRTVSSLLLKYTGIGVPPGRGLEMVAVLDVSNLLDSEGTANLPRETAHGD